MTDENLQISNVQSKPQASKDGEFFLNTSPYGSLRICRRKLMNMMQHEILLTSTFVIVKDTET